MTENKRRAERRIMAGFIKKVRIGDVLIREGVISEKRLHEALELQKQKPKGTLIGETLIELGYVTEEKMAEALQKHLQIEYVDLRKIHMDEKAVRLVTEPIARKYRLIPFAFSDRDPNRLRVAMADPQDFMALDDLSIIICPNSKPTAFLGTSNLLLINTLNGGTIMMKKTTNLILFLVTFILT